MPKKVDYNYMTLTSVGESSEFNNVAGVFGNVNTNTVTEAPGDSEVYGLSSATNASQYVRLTNDPVEALDLVKVYADTNKDGNYDAGVDVQIWGGADGVAPSTVTLDELLAWSKANNANLILRFDDSNSPDGPDRDFNDIVLLVEFTEAKVKANSGRGNNDETNGGLFGTNDIDPGNSGAHNQGGDYNGMPDWNGH